MKRREIILTVSCALLALLLILVIMLQKWGLSLWGNTIDYTKWGSWSEAISGIATSIALIIALTSVVIEKAKHKSTQRRLLLDEETSIFIWLTSKEVVNAQGTFIGRVWDIKIQNATKFPIYRWKITFENFTNHICSLQKRPLLPGENVFNLPFFDNIEPNNSPEAILTFLSKSDEIWIRTTKGEIKLGSEPDIICTH